MQIYQISKGYSENFKTTLESIKIFRINKMGAKEIQNFPSFDIPNSMRKLGWKLLQSGGERSQKSKRK